MVIGEADHGKPTDGSGLRAGLRINKVRRHRRQAVQFGHGLHIPGIPAVLGGHIVDQLLAKGWDVTAVIRPYSDAAALQAKGVQGVQAPLDNATELTLVMPAAPDAVFHVAGNTSLWRRGNAQQYRDNVLGTRAMVSAALKNVAGRFVHTSSISAWGIQDTPVNEQTPSNAANDWIGYNRSKYLAEQEVENGIRQGLDAVILNPCGIIGAGDSIGR